MSGLSQASFFPEKLDYSPLLELAHLTSKNVINASQTDKVNVKEDKEVNKQYDR
jgi:hypothetical protein